MTSSAATIALTFDTVDVQDLDGIFLELSGGFDESPTVRGEDVTVPYADGQTARPRRFHERRILLTGFVRGVGSTRSDAMSDYRTNIRAMKTLFDATGDPADLVATLEDGATATISARTLSLLTAEVVRSEFATVSIELLAVADWVVVS